MTDRRSISSNTLLRQYKHYLHHFPVKLSSFHTPLQSKINKGNALNVLLNGTYFPSTIAFINLHCDNLARTFAGVKSIPMTLVNFTSQGHIALGNLYMVSSENKVLSARTYHRRA